MAPVEMMNDSNIFANMKKQREEDRQKEENKQREMDEDKQHKSQ